MEKLKEKYNSIDKALSKFRNLALVAIIGSLIVAIFLGIAIVYVSSNNMLVIDKEGDIVSAIKVDDDDYFFIEADNHIRLFYSRFFTYDRSNYKSQVELGINLCGSSGRRLYETYTDKGWFDVVVNNDYKINSMVVGEIEMKQNSGNAIEFMAKGIQVVSKEGLEQKRNLHLRGRITKDRRVKILNPHGLIINDIVITNNDVIN